MGDSKLMNAREALHAAAATLRAFESSCTLTPRERAGYLHAIQTLEFIRDLPEEAPSIKEEPSAPG